MRIRYTAAAREDLRDLRRYLTSESGANVAVTSVGKIVADISALKQHPGLMRPLSDKIARQTKYKYFLCGKYSIAILAEMDTVISVIRIVDGRTDYAKSIFVDSVGVL